jgi:uncharacterized cupredoxin-like copper-binding protein
MTRSRGTAAVLFAGLLAGLTAVASPAGTASSAGATVTVTLSEWKLSPGRATVPAGRVTFVARNAGTMPHELLVVRSDRHHHLLRLEGGKAVEAGRVGRIPRIPNGASKRITLKLTPGKYVLLCNILGHYQAGQYATLRVR